MSDPIDTGAVAPEHEHEWAEYYIRWDDEPLIGNVCEICGEVQ